MDSKLVALHCHKYWRGMSLSITLQVHTSSLNRSSKLFSWMCDS